MNANKLGDRLRHILWEQRLTQRSAAEKTGVSKATLSDAITGKRIPSAAILAVIAERLNVDANELMRLAGYLPEGEPDAKSYYYRRICEMSATLSQERQEAIMKMLEGLIRPTD